MPRPRVCTHRDEERRLCGRRATPSSRPARCIFHVEEVRPKEILDEILQQPEVRAAAGRLSEIVDQALSARVTSIIDRIGNVVERVAAPGPRGSAPPPRPAPKPEESPRAILHFTPDEPLTVKLVKDRHRALASIIHPDKGGKDASMQRLNIARDALLKELQ